MRCERNGKPVEALSDDGGCGVVRCGHRGRKGGIPYPPVAVLVLVGSRFVGVCGSVSSPGVASVLDADADGFLHRWRTDVDGQRKRFCQAV